MSSKCQGHIVLCL